MKNQVYLFLLAFFLAGNLIAEETAPKDNEKIYKKHSHRGFYNSEITEYEKFLIQEAEKNKNIKYYVPFKARGDVSEIVADEI